MKYPQIVDYQDAVQDPLRAFLDTELQAGKVTATPLGLPRVLSGGFALTYEIKSGRRTYAVRCFHREVPAVEKRYAAISRKLKALSSDYFADFDFQARGIKIGGNSYPIVKMDWVEGHTLGVHIAKIASNKYELEKLRGSFRALANFLENKGIAHGDLQNDNVIVDKNGSLKLIDYDGMFVPGMSDQKGNEVGHRHFQHPKRGITDFGPHMDRFSFIVIEIGLEALCEDPSLFKQFGEGGLAIVFKAGDYADPAKSAAFTKLKSLSASLSDSVGRLEALCTTPVERLPTLNDFRANRNIPGQPINVRSATSGGTYIGAFPVLDASDFDATLARVGQRVELVGKVVSVKEGVGKRGIGRGKPYVFVNFGNWLADSVRLTIWAEGLSNLSVEPNSTWVGKWLSVTGLIEPPYDGKHFGKAYRSVGITISRDGEIQHIDENDAFFRLGRRQQKAKLSNKEILTAIKAGTAATSEPITLKSPPPSAKATNQHGAGSSAGSTASAATATHQGVNQTGTGASQSNSASSTVWTSNPAPSGQTQNCSNQTTKSGKESSGWATYVVILLLIGLIRLAVSGSTHKISTPTTFAPVPTHTESIVDDHLGDNKNAIASGMGDQRLRNSPLRDDKGILPTALGNSTQPPYTISQSQFGTGPLSVPAEQDDFEETKPSFGQLEFSRANIRYCLFQQERLEAIRELSKVQAATDFIMAANDRNIYCHINRYRVVDQEFVQRQVTNRKATLQEEGQLILSTWLANRITSPTPPRQTETLPPEPTISLTLTLPPKDELASGESLDEIMVKQSLQAQKDRVSETSTAFSAAPGPAIPSTAIKKVERIHPS